MTKYTRIYFKGGSWLYVTKFCQSAYHGWGPRDNFINYGGFRIVLRETTDD